MRVITVAVSLLSLASEAHGSTFLRQRQPHEAAPKENQAIDNGTQEDGTYWERLLQNAASMQVDIVPPTSTPPLDGDGSVGDDCFDNDDCQQKSCILDPPNPEDIGRCTCNPDLDETGCEGDYFCATPEEIGLAVGELISVAPFCKLPVGAPCDPTLPSDCLTSVCSDVTSLCACNPNTNWPCDVESGEFCLDSTDGFVCAPLDGDGSVGDDCFDNDDCQQQICVEDPPIPSGIGRCTCNPDLEDTGCDGDHICATPEDIATAVGELISVANFCKLPVGASCDPEAPLSDCLTTVCSDVTSLCTCNPNTNWPCDVESGEYCLDSTDGFVCAPLDGDGSVGDPCFTNDDCQQESCVEDPPLPSGIGRCSCNPDLEDTGCEGDYFCATLEDVANAVGESINVSPFCKLPVGAPCDPTLPNDCLTTICSDMTSSCTCNPNTNWPCDVDGGELCLDSTDGFTCAPLDGDGSIGDPCFTNGDCQQQLCVEDPPTPSGVGRCTCNPDLDDTGCGGNSFCATPRDIATAVGELVSVANFCKLPVDAPCDPSDPSSDCVTAICNDATGLCACNPDTNWPCDIDGGELCLSGIDGLACKKPETPDRSIGSICENDSDCDSGVCYMGLLPPDIPRRCACNPDTNAGCSEMLECYGTEELADIQGIADLPNDCYLPIDAACDGRSTVSASCVTGTCDEATNRCASCNDFTSWPCNEGETCFKDESGSLACGVGSPEPQSNSTICPDVSDTDVCTTQYDPVVCDGCEYSNQCVATSADPNFTNATCVSLLDPSSTGDCPTFGGICTLEYAPVNCSGCEYSNQCFATGANANYTAETCDRIVTPLPPCPSYSGPCTLENEPVDCFGCLYANQCVATGANSSYTNETCTPVTIP